MVYLFLHRYRRTTLLYRRYHRYRWTSFSRLLHSLAITLTNPFTERFYRFTDGVFLSPSVPMDNISLPMVNCFTIGTVGTDGQAFRGLPHTLAITLTTSFTKGFSTFTDGAFSSPSVWTDSISLPTVNCLYHRYRRYRWTSFSTATSCPWKNANYLFHQRIFNV